MSTAQTREFALLMFGAASDIQYAFVKGCPAAAGNISRLLDVLYELQEESEEKAYSNIVLALLGPFRVRSVEGFYRTLPEVIQLFKRICDGTNAMDRRVALKLSQRMLISSISLAARFKTFYNPPRPLPGKTIALQRTLKRADLRPGMYLKNKTTGSIGIVRADPDNPHRLMRAADRYVAVKATSQIGKVSYTCWSLENLVRKVSLGE